MIRKKKIITAVCIAACTLLLVWGLCNAHISRNTKRVIDSVYETQSLGGYGYFSLNMGYGQILSEQDYRTIAAGSSGIWQHDPLPSDLHWDWDIHGVHTLFWGWGASTYVHDQCTVTGSDGTLYSGYDRHIRLDWEWNPESGHLAVVSVYEYITPEFPCNVYDLIDSLF